MYTCYLSRPVSIASGVPQGSHLGPLLFVLFINDLTPKLKNLTLLYADDLKMYAQINSIEDCVSLQSDIASLVDWCSQNSMSLNVKKCSTISFTRVKKPILFQYNVDGFILERRQVVRDLGVMFDGKLSFTHHYDTTAAKCRQLLGFVCRMSREFKSTESVLLLYRSLILSRLEYASVVWSPYYQNHIDRLESIQRRTLKVLTVKRGLKRELRSYSERLSFFGLQSLYGRRQMHGILHLYKILNGLLSTSLLSEIYLRVPNKSPRLERPFSVPLLANNVSFNNPIHRICRDFNKLINEKGTSIVPDIYSSSLNSFKFNLSKLME